MEKKFSAQEVMAMNRKERRRIAKFNKLPMLNGSQQPYETLRQPK